MVLYRQAASRLGPTGEIRLDSLTPVPSSMEGDGEGEGIYRKSTPGNGLTTRHQIGKMVQPAPVPAKVLSSAGPEWNF